MSYQDHNTQIEQCRAAYERYIQENNVLPNMWICFAWNVDCKIPQLHLMARSYEEAVQDVSTAFYCAEYSESDFQQMEQRHQEQSQEHQEEDDVEKLNQQQQQQQKVDQQTDIAALPACQLTYWNQLEIQYTKTCPELAVYLNNFALLLQDKSFPFQQQHVPALTEYQLMFLEMLNNNVFVKVFDTPAHPAAYCVTKQVFGSSTFFNSGLCQWHRHREFIKFQQQQQQQQKQSNKEEEEEEEHSPIPLIYLDTDLPYEPFPEGLSPGLYQVLNWYRTTFASHAKIRCFTYQYSNNADHGSGSGGENDDVYYGDHDHHEHENVVLTPYHVACPEEMRMHHEKWLFTQKSLYESRSKHLGCMFCFPSPLSIVAHSMLLNYQTSPQNIPRQMRTPTNCNWMYIPQGFQYITSALSALLESKVASVQMKRGGGDSCGGGGNKALLSRSEALKHAYWHAMNQLWKESQQNMQMLDYMLWNVEQLVIPQCWVQKHHHHQFINYTETKK